MKPKHRVLVTGASGFLGASVLEALSKRPIEVVALGHSARTASVAKETGNVNWRFADIRDKTALRDIVEGCDTVIHLVGLLTERPKKGITHQRVVVEGSQCLVEACADAGVRKIIYVSAAGTHSQSQSLYHQAKWKVESIIKSSGLAWTIFRPSLLFANRIANKKAGSNKDFVATIVQQFRWAPFIALPGAGASLCQPLCVADLAESIANAIDSADHEIVDAGGLDKYSYARLFRDISRANFKRKLVIHLPMWFMKSLAKTVFAKMSHPPLSYDQLLMLEDDNLADPLSDHFLFGGELTQW
jgi:uncharacterized protein YbjT (DUF2867 family)